MSIFDDENKVYITFDPIKKIIEELDLKIKKRSSRIYNICNENKFRRRNIFKRFKI